MPNILISGVSNNKIFNKIKNKPNTNIQNDKIVKKNTNLNSLTGIILKIYNEC